jgi:hypothetical protein
MRFRGSSNNLKVCAQSVASRLQATSIAAMSDTPKRLESRSWSTSSVAGAVSALDNYDIVKKELPDDPDELKQMIEAHRMYDFGYLVWDLF